MFLGPRDKNSPITDSLLSGFSPMRLRGLAAPLPPTYAIIPADKVFSFPHYGGKGCSAIGVAPTDLNMSVPPPGHNTPEPLNTLPATFPAYN